MNRGLPLAIGLRLRPPQDVSYSTDRSDKMMSKLTITQLITFLPFTIFSVLHTCCEQSRILWKSCPSTILQRQTSHSTPTMSSTDTSTPMSERDISSINSDLKSVSTMVSADARLAYDYKTPNVHVRGTCLDEIFSENVLAKILQVARRGLEISVCRHPRQLLAQRLTFIVQFTNLSSYRAW